ncbi:MAG: putative zinc-binding metallopeptidase [Bacteroidales bacterium]
MKYDLKITIAICLSLLLLGSACSTDYISSDSIIKDENGIPNEVDTWIAENMTKPYNIEVVYKWEDEETDLAKNLVPPEQEKVIPFLNVLKDLWLDQYEEIAGKDFIKSLTPKQILLVGSPNINSDGTITEGTAEGGRKIVLYSVNHFDATDVEQVKEMIHIVHHEFAHILHQTEEFDVSFNDITPAGYTSTWYNVELQDARNSGFVTPYAMLNTKEDFVEMVSNFIILTPKEWQTTIDSVQNKLAKDALKEKELIVADYFLQVWNIDIYKFQLQLSNKIKGITDM